MRETDFLVVKIKRASVAMPRNIRSSAKGFSQRRKFLLDKKTFQLVQ